MSNLRVKDAKMEGFEGPFFPQPLEIIQEKYRLNDRRLNIMLFTDIAGQLHEGKLLPHHVTSDAYDWPFCEEFEHNGLTIRVTFPQVLDTIERRDGTTSDRHVAMYVRGKSDSERRAHAARILLSIFDIEYDSRYYR